MSLVAFLAASLLTVVLVTLLYRWVFAVAYLARGRSLPSGPATDRQRRFALIIPAHDEELLIGEAIRSARSVDYDSALIEVVVIADNCSDHTAAHAREQGAKVLERSDPANRGKGQALAFALEHLDLGPFDAVAIVDADNLVDPGFFRAMNRELERGRLVLQGYDGLSNPGESVLTRLMHVTSVMKNLLYCGGKAVLGVPTLLMGTGMVFERGLLERVGWMATSVGEDLDQSFSLRELGIPIWFVPDARVYAQEAASLSQGYVQRQRWATGRQAARRRGIGAILQGLRRGDGLLVEAGVEILVPSYSMTMNLTLMAALLSLVAWSAAPWLLLGSVLIVLLQGAEVAAALYVLGASAEYVRSLAFTPVFLAWKGVIDLLAVFGYRRDRWTRTQRHTEHSR